MAGDSLWPFLKCYTTYYILHTDAVYTVYYILLPALVCSIVCKYDKYHAVYYTVT